MRTLALSMVAMTLAGCGGSTITVDADDDGWPRSDDCNDDDPAIYPGAPELCDGVDNDCDGGVDLDVPGTPMWFADADGDGDGDPTDAQQACEAPEGRVQSATDCDDDDPLRAATLEEVCDGVDNDCDGEVDVGALDERSVWADVDGDGYGDPRYPSRACELVEGFADNGDDCDDADPLLNPDTAWVPDADGDGHGVPGEPIVQCEPVDGRAPVADDCDDAEPEVNPSAFEYCNERDDDCDGEVDEDAAVDAPPWFLDTDGDGYGAPDASVRACERPPGYSPWDDDCHPADPLAYPGSHEEETPGDGVDTDCDGLDVCTDLTCDGYDDLFIGSLFATGYVSPLYPGGFSGLDPNVVEELSAGAAYDSFTADADGDGYLDLVVAGGFNNQLSWYPGGPGGPTDADRITLTVGGRAYGRNLCLGDVNGDGALDLVVAVTYAPDDEGTWSYNTDSVVFYGSASGWNSGDSVELPTEGPYGCATADTDGDGDDEVLFGSVYRTDREGENGFGSRVRIYDGDPGGLDPESVTEIDLMAAWAVTGGDLDGDGYGDFVVGGYHDTESPRSNPGTILLHGSATGVSADDTTELSTPRVGWLSIADLDQDGLDDLVVSSWYDYTGYSYNTTSYVYWQSSTGFSDRDRAGLPTQGSRHHVHADLDGDGWEDLVFAGYYGTGYDADTQVYWGASTGFSPRRSTSLPGSGTVSVATGDYDADGHLDVALANYYSATELYDVPSYVYWGSARGLRPTVRSELPSRAATSIGRVIDTP